MSQREMAVEVDNQRSMQVIRYLESFSKSAEQKGVRINPWGKMSLAKLLSLSRQEQDAIQSNIQSYAELISLDEIIPIEEKKDTSEKDLLKLVGKKLGIVFDEEVFKKITDDDIIEIYDHNLHQIYRNFGFFNLCSYNLLDLVSFQFHELYERSVQVNTWLMGAGQILAERPYSLAPISLGNIPKHVMREKFSEKKISFMIEFKEMYPVYTWNREFYGYLILQGAQRMPDAAGAMAFI